MTTMMLGELKSFLKRQKPEAEVFFDFCRCRPTKLASYRGDYKELALAYEVADSGTTTVADLLKVIDAAYVDTFHGYKGGEYEMGPSTQVWVDNWGDWTQTMLVSCFADDDLVILITANEEADNARGIDWSRR